MELWTGANWTPATLELVPGAETLTVTITRCPVGESVSLSWVDAAGTVLRRDEVVLAKGLNAVGS